MSDDFRYDDLRQVAISANGEEAYLTFVKGEDGLTVSIPSDDLPRAAGLLLSASGEVSAKTDRRNVRSIRVKEFGISAIPDGRRLLSFGIQTGAARLSLQMTREQLLELAQAILHTEGVIPAEKAGTVQ